MKSIRKYEWRTTQMLKEVGLLMFLAALTVCCLTLRTSQSRAGQTVVVTPGENLQTLVNQYPAGTTFTLASGVHRMQSVVPKSYDTFNGEASAVLSGAALLTSFSKSGSYWVATVKAAVHSSYPGYCRASTPHCTFPEDLFFDSHPKVRAGSLAGVHAGMWYLDYATEKAYMADDPAGHTVEVSLLPQAFSGKGYGVTIFNVIVEKYASLAGEGAIDSSAGTNWAVRWSEARHNHGMGVRTGTGMYLYHCNLHDNGQLGTGGSGSNILMQNSQIAFNNYAGYNYYWEAGGAKFSGVKNLKVQYSSFHDNLGPGLNDDTASEAVEYDSNSTSNNREAGILHEIGYNALIQNNYVANDGFNPDGTNVWWGSGIYINTSSHTEVKNNTLVNCMNGITLRYDSRGKGPNGLPYVLQNVDVHNNTITQTTGMACALVKAAVYTSFDNHFQDNTFHLASSTYKYFYWLAEPWTLAQWNQYASLH